MYTSQHISLVLDHWVNVGSSDANNATWRTRVLEKLQDAVEELWDESDWDFKHSTATLSLPAGASTVAAPADFAYVGENGGLFLPNNLGKLGYLDPNSLQRTFYEASTTTARPTFYTVARQVALSYVPYFIFDCLSDAAYTLRLCYDSAPPVLTDAPTAPTVAIGSATGITGTFSYRVTFVATDGSESEAGTVSASVSPANQKVNLTAIPVGTSAVTSRKLYRNKHGETVYYLLATLADNTTTTYTDTTADASLGAAISVSSNLQRIPGEYHRSVLFWGVLSKIAPDFGDARAASYYEPKYREALARMKARRRHGLEDLTRMGDQGLPTFGMW